MKKSQSKKKSVSNFPLTTFYSLLFLTFLALIVFFIYSKSLNYNILTFDDNEYFQNYPEVLTLTFKNVLTYFKSYYVLMYQPLPILSFAINYHFDKLNPTGYHFVNTIFHLANIFLVYFFFKKLTGKFLISLFVVCCFALYPLNVEAIVWISARSSGMYLFFYLLAMILHLKRLENYPRNNNKYYIVVFILFLFSCFSKAQAVTLPIVLLSLTFYKQKKFTRRDILEIIPLFLVSVSFGLAALTQKDTMSNITQGMMKDYTFIDSIFLICYSVTWYFVKIFIPNNLSAIYVYPPKVGSFLPWYCYISSVIISLPFLFYFFRKRIPHLCLWGLTFFFVTIAINLQFIPSRAVITADRYLYMPALGLFTILAIILDYYVNTKGTAKKIALVTAFFLLIIYTTITYQRIPVWQSDETLITDIISKNPPHPYLTRAYGILGNNASARGEFNKAIDYFTTAIDADSSEGLSYWGRGMVYNSMGHYEVAIADLNKAVELQPENLEILLNRAIILVNLKREKEAIDNCSKIISENPDIFRAYHVRGSAKVNIGMFYDALKDFSKAISINPNFSESWKNKGLTLLHLKLIDSACVNLKVAQSLGDLQASEVLNANCR